MFRSSSNRNSASALQSSVLPTPVGSQEDERADRPIAVLQAGARAANGVGDRLDRLVLVDHPLVDLGLHPQEFFAFALQHPRHGDSGPQADDAGDVLFGHLLAQQPLARLLSSVVEVLFQLGQTLFGRLELLFGFEARA